MSDLERTFTELLLFQVKPDKVGEFEELIAQLKLEQAQCEGCVGIRYFKRFYTFDGVELGAPPRALTKIVKCVKYYAYWEFDTIEYCGMANGWFFERYLKAVTRLLIAPFDISSGYSL